MKTLYEQWLRNQSAAERKKLLAVEREFAAGHVSRLDALARVVQESMRGHCDRPAGPSRLGNGSGDWSWKPARDKALGDNMVAFRPKAVCCRR